MIRLPWWSVPILIAGGFVCAWIIFVVFASDDSSITSMELAIAKLTGERDIARNATDAALASSAAIGVELERAKRSLEEGRSQLHSIGRELQGSLELNSEIGIGASRLVAGIERSIVLATAIRKAVEQLEERVFEIPQTAMAANDS